MKFQSAVVAFICCTVLVACGKKESQSTESLNKVMPQISAEEKIAREDLEKIIEALKLYKLDNGRYPATHQGLQALIAKPDTEPLPENWKQYLIQIPKDPWGKEYIYRFPGNFGTLEVLTYGADGEMGGDGVNYDTVKQIK